MMNILKIGNNLVILIKLIKHRIYGVLINQDIVFLWQYMSKLYHYRYNKILLFLQLFKS
jgi:hypothetical protein